MPEPHDLVRRFGTTVDVPAFGGRLEVEARGILYLFKIKRSRNIQKLFRILSGGKGWKDCGSGWEALEQRVKLDGWQHGRRVPISQGRASRRYRLWREVEGARASG